MSDLLLYNMIDGQRCSPAEGGYISKTNPATGMELYKIPQSSKVDVDRAVQVAKRALDKEWKNTSFDYRSQCLYRVANLLEERLEDFALAETNDTGKPIWLTRRVDIPRAIHNLRFFAGAILHQETGSHQMADAINYTIRKPLGVVALITPWNLPLYLLTWKLAPALAMGNTIVAKPSELTPHTTTMLCELFEEAGIPSGVFNVIHGEGPSAGSPLVEHPDIKAVSFTGGTKTGEIVAKSAAPQFKKLSLELGGKNSSVVFEDCDFEKTVSGVVRAGFLNQGQICLCGSRVLVHESIFERFVDALVEELKTWNVGNPLNEGNKMGSLISFSHREKVEGYIQKARDLQGTIRFGGKRPQNMETPFDKGAFLEPTLITGLEPTSSVSMEEIFGPVVVVHSFRDEDEALQIANSVEYGLAASVWTQDIQRAHRVSARLDTGMVWVNTWLKRDLRVPFGGVKNSGVGREGGRMSLEFYSESQNICIQL
jgi:aminomuconate-semialdehyde/2-hydroxymuconate-6-semialdehyde dehydrogenase